MTVLKIFKITNETIDKKFSILKEEFENKGISTESKIGYHGCIRFNNIDNICEEGFISQFNKLSAFGKGTYFSTDHNYCHKNNYSPKMELSLPISIRQVFLCEFLPGNICKGVPQAVPGYMSNSNLRYNTQVNDLVNPTIFSVFNDSQVRILYSIFYITK